jgi:hypothetical protein
MPGQRLCISSWGEIDWSAVPVTMPATSRPSPALLIGEESGRLAGAQSTLETTGIGQPRPPASLPVHAYSGSERLVAGLLIGR